jgi:hypothetical protein
MINSISELFSFLKNPTLTFSTKLKTNKIIIHSFIFYYVLILLSAFLFKYLDSIVKLPPHKINTYDHPIIEKIVFGVFIAPFTEEIAFRLYLKFSALNISASISVLLNIIISAVTNTKVFQFNLFSLYKIIFCLSVFFILKYLINRNWNKVEIIFIKNFNYIFYTSAIIFSLLHLQNLEFNNSIQYFYIPILIFPQFFLGLILGYLRFEKGFAYSFLAHILINTPIVLLSILAKNSLP